MNWLSSKATTAPIVETMPQHPYYPLGLQIANYVANDRNVPVMLTLFLGGWVVILGTTWLAIGKFAPRLRTLDKIISIWFVLTGTIHFFFEGYFAYNHTRMGPAQDLFGQLWKEYSLSDSRYLVSDPFVLCMETITAIAWGPLSYLTFYTIVTSNPFRYPLQAIVSLGQLYGDVLYYATSLFDLYYKNVVYCRPEAYYFWFYFFFMNFIWIVIPTLLLYQSSANTAAAFRSLATMSTTVQGNGTLNGAAKNPKAANTKKNK